MPSVYSVTVSESNGLTFLDVDNAFATARISLFGGHILSFVPKSDNKERLWVSPHAYLNGERPIRGGIPVCWPWFSDDHGREKGALPAHGFLRTQVWKLVDSEESASGTTITLSPSFTRAEGFENDCTVTMVIAIGESMDVSLVTENIGVAAFDFNCALHTYFHVNDIQQTLLKGIDGQYKDKLDEWAVKPTPSPYAITGETDRIHLAPIETTEIEVGGDAFTEVISQGNDSLVVWNPWQGAASISDMDPFGYKHMLCVETSLTQGRMLAPGESHTLRQTVVPK
ncbi:D-hexose-6-phosphate mutarotase [Alteromonas sp. BL110]|uniref:D-hexose-6-phosphate mutarotase n=1 Tax=Alteromonas sp. BL110 TaxID=1714845 RepID=UPI000E54C538|nr:D-hexose-6-phosphate mutarotase [Alteromonas sp. BL110]AXT39998.1 D-hexose-6-phosphate mutarotase [Alteromonas sp. BL110]RKM79227.1 D-hexose-6-phosphate mutarotase [Alteromonas sp. BL110]